MPITPVEQKFILHWGEMGTRWGINRTVAQVHALLFVSPKALHAEEIASTLAVARSNVSNSLRELQGWGIVRVTHVLGDRRDHFESVKDVWEIFRIVAEERKRREIDPTLRVLQEKLVHQGTDGRDAELSYRHHWIVRGTDMHSGGRAQRNDPAARETDAASGTGKKAAVKGGRDDFASDRND